MPEECREYARLQGEAHRILKKLEMLTAAQLKAFETENDAEFRRLDRELELTVGEKERGIGALRQHAREHGCQPRFLLDE